jgi:hypothetical protein
LIKAGSIAGCAVDLSLYPIDTIKTRLQEKNSLRSKGNIFSSLYSGVGSVLIGSGPSSALFFTAYNLTKQTLHFSSQWKTHIIAATFGEIVFKNIYFYLKLNKINCFSVHVLYVFLLKLLNNEHKLILI